MRQERHTFSARQRQIVVTFQTVEDAEAWDRLDLDDARAALVEMLLNPVATVARK